MNTAEFVTLEQAHILKLIGFNQPCLYHFEGDDIVPNDDMYGVSGSPDIDVEDFYTSYNTNGSYIDAPTLYQVKTWLKCQWNYFIEITYDLNTYKYACRIICNGLIVCAKSDSVFTNEIKALSAGISKCLKFVK